MMGLRVVGAVQNLSQCSARGGDTGADRLMDDRELGFGQEATGVRALALLGDGDVTYTTHRNHGHLIARGVPKDGGMRHDEQTPVSWDSRHG